MSTFDGYVSEFPQIRIDQFRQLAGRVPPLACFLSHVHSDHLGGLETFKAPFVFCSPTTREILLRLEKFPHRMNFSKGILESRKQTYKHLKALLKPIPPETPTLIELSPGNSICVTLFDANHCSGAVMFLIEGQGKAILYTGDIRSEDWWVNSLARHPKMIIYTSGKKRLDKIYLDTTFATKVDKYLHFPPKAEGLQELVEKLEGYPDDTIFHFNAWTFGYEDVWLTLSQVLNSPIHLDRYRYGLYTSVSKNTGIALECREAPLFYGFKCGNAQQPGILTQDKSVRLHSCERGTSCPCFDPTNQSRLVTITPIISRHKGREMRELGAGGGHGDLDQKHELDLTDIVAVQQLFMLCASKIKDEMVLKQIVEILKTRIAAKVKGLQLEADNDGADNNKLDLEAIPIDDLPDMLAEMAKHGRLIKKEEDDVETVAAPSSKYAAETTLPRSITFPFSRHSSHNELRLLVAALRPRDVWPNTAPPPQHWNESMSMENFFGDLCDREQGHPMEYDTEMRAAIAELHAMKKRKRAMTDTQGREVYSESEEDNDDSDGDEDEPDDFVSAEQGYQTDRDVPSSSPPKPVVRPLLPPPAASLSTSSTRRTIVQLSNPSTTSKPRIETELKALPPKSVASRHQPVPPRNLDVQKAEIAASRASLQPSESPQRPSLQLPREAAKVMAHPVKTPVRLQSFQTPAARPISRVVKPSSSMAKPASPAPREDSPNKPPLPPPSTASPIAPTPTPKQLTALDDRINLAFAEDDLEITSSLSRITTSHAHTTAQLSRVLHASPAAKARRTERKASPSARGSSSASERLNLRRRAFEAASTGVWGDEIELLSVKSVGKADRVRR